MRRENLLQDIAKARDEAREALDYAKDKRLPVAIRGRLRALHAELASLHYQLDTEPPASFWTRLRGFLKELA